MKLGLMFVPLDRATAMRIFGVSHRSEAYR